jgi:hypothetical protein
MGEERVLFSSPGVGLHYLIMFRAVDLGLQQRCCDVVARMRTFAGPEFRSVANISAAASTARVSI